TRRFVRNERWVAALPLQMVGPEVRSGRRIYQLTIDVRAVLKGLLKDHLRASDHALAADVFPGSDDVKPIAGLVASS
ncbi:MAG TPA: hypothetical protein VFO15_16095, partial [Xanthobacteraceae bacterium]|nr:hypothetical protein [Xanthobacteraceae bacterium]